MTGPRSRTGLRAARQDHASSEQQREAPATRGGTPAARTHLEREVMVPVDDAVLLRGRLAVPAGARGVVVLARGSDSSRQSPRLAQTSRLFQAMGLGTLLLDLLTSEEMEERRTRQLRFNMGLLGLRMAGAARWLQREPHTTGLSVGYFGAHTGAGAALSAAASRPELVGAVVSRGGRPDLAGAVLPRVRAPTLLLVGGADTLGLDINRRAYADLQAQKHMEIIPGATHHFQEDAELERVAELAGEWFLQHLGQPRHDAETDPALAP
ncbi:dienelactone hydrolase family protein [Corallococcus sp. CA047B]|uniref:dienelactone hydrolase family protein n=1 Tax=Corallococcus sp. CA047B TaxID=2316729 RepID=UPI001F243368|nr:dienelactone hydrolase family protein [Corallococcus sp. CA047B]